MMRAIAAAGAARRLLSPSSIALLRPLSSSTRLRSLEQAVREGTASKDEPLRSPDAPLDPAQRADDVEDGGSGGGRAGNDDADSRKERDARIAVAGGGFGPAIIAQNLAEREAAEAEAAAEAKEQEREQKEEGGNKTKNKPSPPHHPHHRPDPRHRVDPTKTPPGIDVPSSPLPHIFSEQLPHAARKLQKRFSEAIEYVKMGEMGGAAAGELRRAKPSSASRHGAAVDITGDAEAVEAETKTQGMPPLGEADDLHRRLAEEMRRREGM